MGNILNEISISEEFSTIKGLVNHLAYLDLSQLNTIEDSTMTNLNNSFKLKRTEYKNKMKVCFWLNLYNYLCVFTVIYKKEFLATLFEWNKFLKNSYFDIGGIIISLYSIVIFIYILYFRINFFGY